MRIDIATLFPELLENYLSESIIGRSRAKNIFEAYCHNIRDYTQDKHRRVDDTPYSERQGMLMQAEPIYRCWQSVCNMTRRQPHVIYMSPQGKTLTQQRCKELSQLDSIFIICGHYEGVELLKKSLMRKFLSEIMFSQVASFLHLFLWTVLRECLRGLYQAL